MDGKGYTQERNVQVLICLMKHHGIRRIIASPGTTNLTFVESVQHDPFFQVFSSVDERSAAYMACGMAAETGEPVALSCTEATASRNYYPGLTEAFYRKLPILAITSTRHIGTSGFGIPQHIDRREHASDVVKCSVQIPSFTGKDDEWIYTVQMNRAILELNHHGRGPVHINLSTSYNPNYGVETIREPRYVDRLDGRSRRLPRIPCGKTVVFVGEHESWSPELTRQVDEFCLRYNALVLADQSGKCSCEHAVGPLAAVQDSYRYEGCSMDVLISIGNISGAYVKLFPKEVWRVNPDGELRDPFRKLRYVFEMEEMDFFRTYNRIAERKDPERKGTDRYDAWVREDERLRSRITELPFSNAWAASRLVTKLPEDSRLYLGILNCLRSWNYFLKPDRVDGFCNTGGFGIDGGMSTMVGASIAAPDRLFFGVFGDLGFFYDMNVLGNREVGKNVRILLVNNGKGAEFRNYFHDAAQFGEDADKFVAAAGHYGNQSRDLVRHYAQDLGYTYYSASGKEEFLEHMEDFVSPVMQDRPVVFEIFTQDRDESEANYILRNLDKDRKQEAKESAKAFLKKTLGEERIQSVKHMLGK